MTTSTKNNKKKSNTINYTAIDKKNVADKIFEHSRDYSTADFVLPLGDTVLKNVHTNQFMFSELPEEFVLANWGVIAKALSSSYNRYTGATYQTNRWYIESVDISVDASTNKGQMTLKTNSLASSLSKYSKDYRDLQKAFTDATNKNNKTAGKSATKDTTNATGKNDTIKNGWWGEWVTKTVKSVVGDETDVLKKCKLIHEYFRWKTRWTRYNDMPYTGGSVSKLEKQWYRHKFNCGDGANYLSAFYACCGASTGIYLCPGHYVVKCSIPGGNTYWCDHSGGEGAFNTLRGFGKTWHGLTGGSYKGKYV